MKVKVMFLLTVLALVTLAACAPAPMPLPTPAVEVLAPAAPAIAQPPVAVAPAATEDGVTILVSCCDGRADQVWPLDPKGTGKVRLGNTQVRVYRRIASSIGPDFQEWVKAVESETRLPVKSIIYSIHGDLKGTVCVVSCGGDVGIKEIFANPTGPIATHLPKEVKGWLLSNVPNQPTYDYLSGRFAELKKMFPNTEIAANFWGHNVQLPKNVFFQGSNGQTLSLSSAEFEAGTQLSLFKGSPSAAVLEYFARMSANNAETAPIAARLKMAEAQGFKNAVLNGTNGVPLREVLPHVFNGPDPAFEATLIMKNPADAALQLAYAEANLISSGGNVYIILPKSAPPEYLQAVLTELNKPGGTFITILKSPKWTGSVNLVYWDNMVAAADPVIMLRGPSHEMAVLTYTKQAPNAKPAVVPTVLAPAAIPTVIGSQPVSADEAATVEKFNALSAKLGSSDGAVIKAVGEEMRKLGAQYIDSQYVLVRSGRVWATGPVRSAVVQRFVTGEISAVSYPIPRLGFFTLERAENIPGGIAGWRLSIPALSLEGKYIAGIPAGEAISEGFTRGLTVIWAGWEIKNIADLFQQTDHMDVGPTPSRMLRPPSAASSLIWLGMPENNKWIETSWYIPANQLQSGWNGLDPQRKAVLPLNEEKPIFLFNGLAGYNIPVTTFPSWGPPGNRVSEDWTYKRINGGYALYLNGQFIPPNTSGDYVAIHVSDFGMWMIPMHYQHATDGCSGLCLQQAKGGQEFLFKDGAQPKEVELCPQASACWQSK